MAKIKLHELLAVEGGLKTQATKVRSDLSNAFEKKRHLYEEKRTVFQSNAEGAAPVTENQSDIQTTVTKEFDLIQPFIKKAIDAGLQVAEANTRAKADIELEDGTVIAKEVPATALLELEKRVDEISTLLASAPTLDPAKGFTPDPDRGDGFFKARPVRKQRTRKDKVPVTLYPHTVEHPAQVQLIDKDIIVGDITENEWSGLITPARKSELINRVEILARAVRKARSRANEAEVNGSLKIGEALLGFIFKK